ncbi:HAD-IIA family hydrolase [Paenibacillus sp. 2RAB27]|uniref:HAD-IIA family hydrolase n=1 Tax=Paenibacillus TaxID=44249 RepID=UPI0028AA1EBB|nr:HAD-IIA family hydrolase [Paenibacillus plantarum]
MADTSRFPERGIDDKITTQHFQRTHSRKSSKELHSFKGYLFDLDGTIYSGSKLLPGVLSTVSWLREQDKSVMFVTNTTIRTKESVHQRLIELGVPCEVDEVLTALCVAGKFFQELEPNATVLMIGEAAMELELARNQVKTTENPLLATHVLVGLDRQFTFEKLTAGVNALRNGAKLIAANPDPFCPIDDGVIPDTWSLVKALETASLQKTVHVIGKPSAYYAQKAFDQLHILPSECLMVGDRLSTDIQFGNSNDMYTALVLTGADAKNDIVRTGIEPDYILQELSEITFNQL